MSDRGEPGGAARGEKIFVAAALAFTLVLRLYTLAPEVAHPGAMLNDNVLHDAVIRAASGSIARGEDPLDSWLEPISVGYPFLRQYQPATHVAAALAHRALGGAASASRIRAILVALAMAAFPFAVYRAARDIGLDRIGAASAAAISPLLEAPLLLGLTDQAYFWRGFGLTSQATGAVLFVLGVGAASRALETGRGVIRAGALVGATFVTHFIFGWLAALIAAALALLARGPLLERTRRLFVIGLVSLAVAAPVILPAVRSAAYANQSAIEPAEKWEGYGIDKLLAWTGNGRLLDGDADVHHATRFPVVSLLAALGIGLAIAARLSGPRCAACGERRFRDLVPRDVTRRLLAILALSALLLAGRPAFGSLVDWVPGARYLQIQRMIVGVHLTAILLGGVAAGAVAAAARACASPRRLVAFGVGLLIVLSPAVRERLRYAAANGEMAARAEAGVAAATDAERLLARLATLPPGRLYAGHARHEALWTRFEGGVPLDGVAVARDIPTIGHLWHPYALAGDLAYFHFDPYDDGDAALFAVRYFLLPAAAPAPSFVREIERAGRFVLYERPATGYFALASAPRRIDVLPSGSYEAASAWYASAERRRGLVLLLALAGESWPPAGPAGRPPRGTIEREEVGSGRFAAEVILDEPGYLVAKIGYHPALGATVDGERHPVACVAPGFAAVRLEAGTHLVRLFVEPDRLRLWLAVAGAAIVAAAVLLERSRRPAAGARGGSPPTQAPSVA